MSVTITPPGAAPADQPPAPVNLTKQPPTIEAEPRPAWVAALVTRIREQVAADGDVRAHLQRARAATWTWLTAERVADDELTREILTQRQHRYEARERELRTELSRVARQLTEHKVREARADADMRSAGGHALDGHEHGRHRDSATDASLRRRKEELEVLLEEHGRSRDLLALDPTKAEIGRARWGRRTSRAAVLVGSVVGGGIVLPVESSPLWLLAALPAAAVALWRAGLVVEEDQAQVLVPGAAGEPVVARLAEQPIAVAPAVPEGTPVTLDDLVQPDAPAAELSTVEQASHEWLMERLLEASIVTNESAKKAKVISMVVQGPGWSATVQLAPGKKAIDAVAKSGELASALGRKSSQIEMAVDSSEDGHDGRFTVWVSDKPNPYDGPPVRSMLCDAERWDFWADGVPLGADARRVRKVLSLLWSSLMIGGLQRYGKTYFARLIAAAAALDPYVRIVLVSGKSSPDWLALKQVADKWVVGQTPAKVREAYETITWATEDLQQRGEALTALAEKDPFKVPEGKVTRELARTREFGLTLLIIDELQNLLVAAQTVKSGPRPNDPAYASMIRDAITVFNRMTSSHGGIAVSVVHRPGPDSPVTPDVRDSFVCRAAYRVKGIDSARNTLGPDAVRDGAAPHTLLEVHKGVAVVDLGEDGGHFTMKADVITLEEFAVVCARGRALRQAAGTLTGFAAESVEAEQADAARRVLLQAVIAAMASLGTDGARLEELAAVMTETDPERWGDLTPEQLGDLLRANGAGNTVKLPRREDGSRPNGYRLDAIEALLRGPKAA